MDAIALPGTAKRRLVEAAVHYFETAGFADAAVADLATKAGVTTGSLYHHFGSKLELYLVVRREMETRLVERMAGAAAVSGRGRAAVRAAVLVAFDAAVHFGVCRILAEYVPGERPDPLADALRDLLPKRQTAGGQVLAAALRAALLAVADGTPATAARASLAYLLPNS
ncbi:TetR family transcriptional regulator [Herbihabitans rhizosphaerae]|uniref:TetR family transcriptional regulator n=1 Tax=Herbihabitans rhizosphaerae TaxID=1872711 RepID=A0A4Q7KNV2_9PSEU|nr:TetR/AcrR family transcriptional regulator [Herbihabitans rhizosphaerae]RZS37650.1 TetR family transcriptional regulator [Herbihabitans rhizosphaerae]